MIRVRFNLNVDLVFFLFLRSKNEFCFIIIDNWVNYKKNMWLILKEEEKILINMWLIMRFINFLVNYLFIIMFFKVYIWILVI